MATQTEPPTKGQMKIWHIPQVGSEVPTFYVPVTSVKEASKILFKFALNAMCILQDTISSINADINHLGCKNSDGTTYSKNKLKDDFETLEKAHKTQAKYMLELVKELQKTYKMY